MQETLFVLGGRPVTLEEAVAVGAGLALFFLFVLAVSAISGRRRRSGAADMEGQLRELAMLQSELAGRMQAVMEQTSTGQAELKRTLDERLDQVSHRMGSTLAETSRQTGENLSRLAERMATIDAAQRNLTELSSRVVGLQQILANKQTRGAFGQGRMEAIVQDGLPRGSYSFQHTLSNGKRPDCVVKMPDTDQVIVVDAKFPLEGFTALKNGASGIDIRDAKARVRVDIGKHIADISERYRIPGETQDTLIMFVPSESIYADLYEGFDDLIQKAYRSRVIIVSPNMLMLAVQTMQAVMKDAYMREQAGVIQLEVARMMDDVGRLRDRVTNLTKHFDQASRDIEQVMTSAQKVTSRGERIVALEFDEAPARGEAAAAPARPALVAGE